MAVVLIVLCSICNGIRGQQCDAVARFHPRKSADAHDRGVRAEADVQRRLPRPVRIEETSRDLAFADAIAENAQARHGRVAARVVVVGKVRDQAIDVAKTSGRAARHRPYASSGSSAAWRFFPNIHANRMLMM